MQLEEKIKELAIKYEIPEALFKEAIEKEKEKVVAKKRNFAPQLVNMIERYTESPNSQF